MQVDINLDWDQIKAVDILMMLQSFTPSTDSVVAQEEKSGPVGIWKEKDKEVKANFASS